MQAATKQVINANQITGIISQKIDGAAFKSWFEPCDISIVNDMLCVVAPNQFSADFIKSVYLNALESVANECGLGVCISACAGGVNETANDNHLKIFTPTPAPTPAQISFNNFITSDENMFVVTAAKKMAAGTATFSPLYIYGATGCGKSLLTECINGAANGRTIMMTGMQFVSEFARAIREQSVFAFKDFCRNCDTFIMDDVHTLSGKRASMDEFMNLIMDLRGANKNIVLTADVAPGALSGFDRRLQSLLASGLVADIALPTANVKKQMLMQSGVATDVANVLAGRIGADGHLIMGVAKKIGTYAELMNETVTVDVAEKLLSDTIAKNKTPIAMVRAMCEKLGVSYDTVCGAGRTRGLVRARQMMMVALKSATNLSLSEIGRYIGDRDHATVLYAVAQIEKMKSGDLLLASEMDSLIAGL